MNLSSFEFFLFFIGVLVIYSLVASKYRAYFLTISSYIFYFSFGAPYLLFSLFFVTIFNFYCATYMTKSGQEGEKKKILWFGISVNLLLLIGFKYFNFINDYVSFIFYFLNIPFHFESNVYVSIIGLSYFVFQAISYLVDVYLEKIPDETSLSCFALSLCFFPKLLQGPIERGSNILPQMRNLSNIKYENLWCGFNLFLWGLFKKVVIADRIGTFVDPVFSNPSDHYGLSFVIATYLFAFQIYFDFSGYTDMARGIARCFNIKLMENFNYPYIAKSVSDFWRRWHISFSSWILDYIFKPVQFSLRYWSKWGVPVALIVTFFASGLWHGAAWTYVFWGLLHGIYLSFGFMFKKDILKLYSFITFKNKILLNALSIFVTFNLVCISWIFFRASSIFDGFYIFFSAISGAFMSFSLLAIGYNEFLSHIMLNQDTLEFIGVILLIMLVVFLPRMAVKFNKENVFESDMLWLNKTSFLFKGVYYGFVIYMILFFGASTESFIYMQF